MMADKRKPFFSFCFDPQRGGGRCVQRHVPSDNNKDAQGYSALPPQQVFRGNRHSVQQSSDGKQHAALLNWKCCLC